MIRILPNLFYPIAIVAETSGLSLEHIIAYVKFEIFRRETHGNSGKKYDGPIGTTSMDEKNRSQHYGPCGIKENRKKETCYFCGRPGNYVDK